MEQTTSVEYDADGHITETRTGTPVSAEIWANAEPDPRRPVNFTDQHARMIEETHAALLEIKQLFTELAPMFAGLADSPIGSMLGMKKQG